MIGNWIHDPNVSWIDEAGHLHVDLLKLALKAEAPITPESIASLSRMVRTYMSQLYPQCDVRLER